MILFENMGIEEMNRIKEFFSKHDLHPTYLEHEPVLTSEQAAKARGFELRQGIKALLFTNGTDWAIVDVPADQKVSERKVAIQLNWSRESMRMATPEEVLQKTGCEIGAVPPFGHKEQIQILADNTIYNNNESGFNIGLRTHTVKIPTREMKIVFEKLKAIEGDFIKIIN